MKPKIIISVCVLLAAAWLITMCVLAERFNVPSADGILYSLPLAVAKHPFDFGIPFLNDFDGYGSSWGHQWPGSMWLKGLIFSMLPYSRTADVAVLSVFQFLTATTAAFLVWKAIGKVWPAVAALILILSDRLLVLACAGNRFETIPVAVIVLLFANSVKSPEWQHAGWRRLTYALAFLCPTLHPYAVVMGGLILGYDYITARLRKDSSSRECAWRLFAFAFGCAAMAGWFIAQPDALRQFTANLTLQNSFYQSWNSVLAGLENYRIKGGLVLWGAGLLACGLFLFGWPVAKRRKPAPISPAWRLLTPALFVTVIVVHTVTRCENFTYLAFGSPFAVMLVCVVASQAADSLPPPVGWLPVTALAAITAMHGILIPYRLLQFQRAGMPDLNAKLIETLDKIPPPRKIFIPHLLWPAAIADHKHEIRWFTLPLASPRTVRENYEQEAYADAKPGDILIIDNGGAGQPDKFGLYPTFPTQPPSADQWIKIDNHKLLFPGTVIWGVDLSIYEFRKN